MAAAAAFVTIAECRPVSAQNDGPFVPVDPPASAASPNRAPPDEKEQRAKVAAAINAARTWFDSAQRKLQAGDAAGAIADDSEAIKAFRPFGPAYVNRGFAFQKLGDARRALADFRTGIALMWQPVFAAPLTFAHRNAGDCEFVLGDDVHAIADLDATFELDASSQRYVLLLKTLAARREKHPAADDELKRESATWPKGWTRSLADFLLGNIAQTELMRRAGQSSGDERRQQECEADFYAAIVHELSGDAQGERDLLHRCVATGVKGYVEYDMAHCMLSLPN